MLYYKPLGYPDGIYRVGPLARLHVADRLIRRKADAEFRVFRKEHRQSLFHYHYARLIEMLYCFEKIEIILNKPDILSKHVRAFAEPNSYRGVGVSEAPRGTLMHDYEIDDNGLITRANLIIATGHNNLAMNCAVCCRWRATSSKVRIFRKACLTASRPSFARLIRVAVVQPMLTVKCR